MDATPLFSVIIPVYNVKNYIQDTINSILSQSCDDYEIVIVDDGSTDGSYEICQTASLAHPDKIRLIHQPNGGVGKARNNGLRHAKGQYISFLDSDDFLESDTLAQLKAIIDRDNPDLICFDLREVPENYQYTADTSSRKAPETIETEALIIKKLQDPTIPCACNAFRRSLIEQHQIRFCEQLYYVEDALFFFTFVTKSHAKTILLDAPLYLYRQRQGSAVNRSFVPYRKIKTEHEGWMLVSEQLSGCSPDAISLLQARVRQVRYRLLFLFIEKYSGQEKNLSREDLAEIHSFVRKYKETARYYQENPAISRGKRGIFTARCFAVSPILYNLLRKVLRKSA